MNNFTIFLLMIIYIVVKKRSVKSKPFSLSCRKWEGEINKSLRYNSVWEGLKVPCDIKAVENWFGVSDALVEEKPLWRDRRAGGNGVNQGSFPQDVGNWLDPDNVDVVFIGRAFRIHKDATNQVTVNDRGRGNHVTMTGRTLADATNTAWDNLLKILLVKGIMSVDDLHLPPTLPPSTLPPCVDNNGAAYCKPMVHKGYCAKSNVFSTFMENNCRKS